MAGAIAQDRESCQFPFVLDEKPTVVLVGSAGERSGGAQEVPYGAGKNKPNLASKILTDACCLMPFAFSSPNDFVRSCQHVGWNRQAKCLRGLQIDYELELRRLLHWQLGRLGTFKNSVDVVCGALEILRFVG
jgi:hypothetical protein